MDRCSESSSPPPEDADESRRCALHHRGASLFPHPRNAPYDEDPQRRACAAIFFFQIVFFIIFLIIIIIFDLPAIAIFFARDQREDISAVFCPGRLVAVAILATKRDDDPRLLDAKVLVLSFLLLPLLLLTSPARTAASTAVNATPTRRVGAAYQGQTDSRAD
jgi:hypothetical protein